MPACAHACVRECGRAGVRACVRACVHACLRVWLQNLALPFIFPVLRRLLLHSAEPIHFVGAKQYFRKQTNHVLT